ncbi:CPBP family intramembrane glutamic endopeptidase [Dactylosporangium sp. AC04546]|uniref:CPBP family intramembrane glutamic endopeptidase n=1 Tax=Dactylosporangium sp. AC04546 TaxID=2862460 RepID=UPI001EE126D4|nr:CPBP family intramembrane glutamic endopeptidase [Dactylosporangium sp. AC04546]WVK86556.1 CPBP family intramembrane glutamic endopeptidase [Dactylosporangium sp. AC04546]
MRTRGVLWFLLIAFGAAWGAIAATRALGVRLDNPLAQLPVAFAPALAAIVVRRFVTREGFGDAGLALRLRPARRYYLLAWLGPIVALAVAAGLATATGRYQPDPGDLPDILPLLVLALLLPPLFWGEEFGWRGYLQQRIGGRPAAAVLVTGVIWGVWHWPLAFAGYTTFDDPVRGLALWTVQTTALGVVLAWLFVRSGSIWVSSLAHAGSNMLVGIGGELLLVERGGLDDDLVTLLALVPVAAAAVVILASRALAPAQLVPAGAGPRVSNGPA